MTLTEELAEWALGLTPGRLPWHVRRAARRHLLDGLGTTVAAGRAGMVRPVTVVATGLGGPGEATVLGTGERVSAPAAALATGALVHALDFDDTHAGGLVHATAAVLPALLAVGEQVDADGEEALVAAVAGYETVCRVAAAAPHAFHARGLHATMACGVFAAALVAARLMRLDQRRTVDALGIAGSQAGGLLEFLATGASTKQLHPGLAAYSGILAARLAAAGADGPASVLEGANGLYAALAGGRGDPAAVVTDLGRRWETTRIGLKPYPACQLVHSTLDAGARAIAAGPLAVDDVAAVRVFVHPDSATIVCGPGKAEPRTAYDAKFSLPWSLAALLVDGTVTLATYGADSLARPHLRALAARVVVVVTEPDGVAADAPGRVEIDLAGGGCLIGTVERSAGGPDKPLDDLAFDDKLAGNVGSADAAARLTKAVHAAVPVSELVALVDELAHPEEDR